MIRNNIYYQAFMYIMDLIGILSIIYIKLNENIFKLCIGKYNIENNIDMNYLYIFIGIVLLKNLFLFKYKEIRGVIFTLTKFILNIFSGGLALFSYKLYQLQTDYIDSIRLKFNLYIHRNWNYGELREYLLDRLLKDTKILDKFKNLEIKLPFSDKVTSNLLADCQTIDDVNKSVDNFIEILEYNKETLEKARLLDSLSTGAGNSIIEQIKTSSLVSSITSSLANANIYLLLGGLTLSVFALAGLYYGLNSNIISLAKETKVIKKGLVHSLELEKKNTENIADLKDSTVKLSENLLSLNKENLNILENQNAISSQLVGVVDQVADNVKDQVATNLEHLNNGLNDLAVDVGTLRNNVKTITDNIAVDVQSISGSCNVLNTELLDINKVMTENNEQIEETLSNFTTFSNNIIAQVNILKDNDKEFMSSFVENREQVKILSTLVKSCMGQLESVNQAVSKIPILENTELRKLVLGIVLEALEMPAHDTLGKDVNAGDTPETGSASKDSTSSVKGTGKMIKRFGNVHTFGD